MPACSWQLVELCYQRAEVSRCNCCGSSAAGSSSPARALVWCKCRSGIFGTLRWLRGMQALLWCWGNVTIFAGLLLPTPLLTFLVLPTTKLHWWRLPSSLSSPKIQFIQLEIQLFLSDQLMLDKIFQLFEILLNKMINYWVTLPKNHIFLRLK